MNEIKISLDNELEIYVNIVRMYGILFLCCGYELEKNGYEGKIIFIYGLYILSKLS